MERHNFVTIEDLSKEKILYLLEMAKEFENHPNRELLKGKVVATLFFEPSTRTQLSFQTAANRLGARVIGFSDAKTSSTTKGETLKDTILMVSNYADVIAMRHSIEGAALYRGCRPVCQRDSSGTYRQCRRRCPHAPFPVSARPLFDIQDPGHS